MARVCERCALKLTGDAIANGVQMCEHCGHLNPLPGPVPPAARITPIVPEPPRPPEFPAQPPDFPVKDSCHYCGYALAGLQCATCPECGADVGPEGVAAAEQSARQRERVISWGLIVAAVLFAACGSSSNRYVVLIGWLGTAIAASTWVVRDLSKRAVWFALIPGIVLGIILAALLVVVMYLLRHLLF